MSGMNGFSFRRISHAAVFEISHTATAPIIMAFRIVINTPFELRPRIHPGRAIMSVKSHLPA